MSTATDEYVNRIVESAGPPTAELIEQLRALLPPAEPCGEADPS